MTPIWKLKFWVFKKKKSSEDKFVQIHAEISADLQNFTNSSLDCFLAWNTKKNIFSYFLSKLGTFNQKIWKKKIQKFLAEISARAYVADPAENRDPNVFFVRPYAWPIFTTKIFGIAFIVKKLFLRQKFLYK